MSAYADGNIMRFKRKFPQMMEKIAVQWTNDLKIKNLEPRPFQWNIRRLLKDSSRLSKLSCFEYA